ncbi:hypothetical protein PFISCL1PPCAC_13134 [Pristionchus fissidentatus]|uniref:NR LBD domain-containing protein n=1 Tax=Pristionchus fissidentatus TaxID=1538716 RepID=A0AAV5VV27_9BILA|nr:hypothetical protein PFISCL1PPCAC_13134 [Pristionchus fissidentatus]
MFETFLNDAPRGNLPGVKKYLRENDIKSRILPARDAVKRMDPRPEEFLVVVALMFWSSEETSMSEEITQISQRYRQTILKELHAFYRLEMGLDNYAARLGELMMMLQVFDRTKEMKEHFEVMHLFGVLPDDNFMYRLQKD